MEHHRIDRFVRLCARFRKEIAFYNADADADRPPSSIPGHVHHLLSRLLDESLANVEQLWKQYRGLVWSHPGDGELLSAEMDLLFADELAHAVDRSDNKISALGAIMLYPPVTNCLHCDRRLKEPRRYEVVVFSLGDPVLSVRAGSHRGYCTSLYCRACHVRYYLNFWVKQDAGPALSWTREYYLDSPGYLQTTERVIMSSNLIEYFTDLMCISAVSATSLARAFNEAHFCEGRGSATWSHLSFQMDSRRVWDAFYLHSLLKFFGNRLGRPLQLSHNIQQQSRLERAISTYNNFIKEHGYDDANHACHDCCRIAEDPSGALYWTRAAVSDGVTLGYPCCGADNCSTPLLNNKHRFCEEHKQLALICCVITCDRAARPGRRTCSIPLHARKEKDHATVGKAIFKLGIQKKLRKGVVRGEDTIGASPACPSKDLEVPRTNAGDAEDQTLRDRTASKFREKAVRARFGRRRTHNEQLTMGTCGVIFGRQTMMSSEGCKEVLMHWKSIWNEKRKVPQVLFYDNNCNMQKHLNHNKDTYFDSCALPVDVFHFKNKHKTTDLFCQQNCDPALWSDLQDSKGKWIFNSSAAEQANNWVGSFAAIVREMLPHNFQFFMDHMIQRRNWMIVRRLQSDGKKPWVIDWTCMP